MCYDRLMTTPSVPPSPSVAVLAQDLRRLVGKLKRRLREQSNAGDLTPSQISVLHRLEKDGPSTTSNLARLESMRPQSMGTVIAALEGAGLVSGAPDPADGRQTILSLTDSCRERMRISRAARQDWLVRTIEVRLSAEEQARLQAAIELIGRLADD